jgi:surfeit locus 1 family protein
MPSLPGAATPAWRRYEPWVLLVAALLGVALTLRLGLWQLDRAAQKTRLQEQIESRRTMPVLNTAGLSGAAPEALHQRRVALQGQWVPAAVVYLDNRQMRGRPGFYVLSPFALSDGTAVLVQRGWLPRDAQDRTRVGAPDLPEGPQVLIGRLAPPPARLLEFEAADLGPIRQNVDLAQLSAQWRVPLRALSVLQLDVPDVNPDGLARDWPEPGTGVHKHHGYAFQWFALAALILILYVWFQFIRPRRQRTGPPA